MVCTWDGDTPNDSTYLANYKGCGMKVQYTKKSGEIEHIEIEHSMIGDPIIIHHEKKVYSLSSFLVNPSWIPLPTQTAKYQKFSYSDGSFEYREM